MRKLALLDSFERRITTTCTINCNLYSRRLVDLCLQHRAATILLVGRKKEAAARRLSVSVAQLGRHYALKEKIMYKAKRVGITVLSE